MNPVILIPSLGRPQKLATTLSQTALHGFNILVGVAHGQMSEYISAHSIVSVLMNSVSLFEVPQLMSHCGAGAPRKWLADLALSEKFTHFLFMDDDVTFRAGADLEALFTTMSHPKVGVVARKDEGFWNFDEKLYDVDPDGFVRKCSRPSQLWGCRADVYQEVGGFSEMPRGEDVDLQLRIKMAGYYIASDGRCAAKGEYFQPTGGMFAFEGPVTGASTAREAADLRNREQCEELNRKYPGIVSRFDAATGKWRLSPSAIKKYAAQYAAGEIRFTADGIVQAVGTL